MDVLSNFEYLCRVCAANTKSKNSVAECVYILKTPALKDKIERYIYLKIADDDPLPKVLCKTCFRQVEATASLSNIAKHTQQVFRDFLNSSLPKHKQVNRSSSNNDYNIQLNNECDEYRPLVLSKAPETTITLAPLKPTQTTRDEVVISLTQKDHESRPRTKTTAINQRRSSTFEHNSSYAPNSIAQRALMPSALPAVQAAHAPAKQISQSLKQPSPAGVINFIQTHGKVTGCTNNGSNIFSMPNSVLQQKRKNLKMALNNIKAVNSGQVSLLKSSQNRQVSETLSTEAANVCKVNKNIFDEPTVEECLPENIIIAAPKQKKKEEQSSNSDYKSDIPKTQSKIQPVTQKSSKIYAPVSSFTEGIILGSVIRDPDLLKLILKALKWPVTKVNSDEQMNRLKNSKFAEIMSDSNLLQDTDLTQLLGPYIAPVLLAAQAFQHNQDQQNKKAPSMTSTDVCKTPTPPAPKDAEAQAVTDLASTIPYKLPPETSVQLVPSSPTEQDSCIAQTSGLTMNYTDLPTKSPQLRKSRTSEISVNAEKSFDHENIYYKKSKTTFDLNNLLVSQYESQIKLNEITNHALNDHLKKSQSSSSRQNQRRKSRSNSMQAIPPSPPNLEDIVLIEPQPSLIADAETGLISDEVNSVSILKDIERNETIFKIPAKEPSAPIITRPIIKRRKTVIQSTKTSLNPLAISCKKDENTKNQPSAAATETPPPPLQIEPQKSDSSQLPSSIIKEQPSTTCSTDTPTTKETKKIEEITPTKSTNIKKTSSKSILGQQLLEAIGLKKFGRRSSNEGINGFENSRDSLRSALKRSLKQAQEQGLKRVKQEEPVKQQADSTTKNVARDSFDEDKLSKSDSEKDRLQNTAHNEKDCENGQTKHSEDEIKEETKREQVNVSSSDMTIRKRGRKRKEDKESDIRNNDDEFITNEKNMERWDDDDDLPLKQEGGGRSSSRPTRTSKTMSKYYKGPDRNSMKSHSMGTRASRHRS